jgi:dephospho-CoA kinase
MEDILSSEILDSRERELVLRLRDSAYYSNLYLVTSNPVKIAHYEYIFDALRLPLRTYSKPLLGYTEQHDIPPVESLRQSVIHASATLKHLGLFFIDDSSFLLRALSDAHCEVPGLRTKDFLNKHTTVESLQRCLEACGNDASAEIVSRIGLNVPGTPFPDVFEGRTGGAILAQPPPFPFTGVPWLSEVSPANFFVPRGESVPLSCLGVEKALRYDTRLKAVLCLLYRIDQLLAFSAFRSVVLRKQRRTPPAQRMLFSPYVLVLSGYSGAGKTTSREHLAKAYGLQTVEESDVVRSQAERLGECDSDLSDIVDWIVSEHGPTCFIDEVMRTAIDLRRGLAVISGVRNPAEIEFLRGMCNCFVVFLDVPRDIRLMRWIISHPDKRDHHPLFKKLEEDEQRWGIERIRSEADFILRNTGNKSVLQIELDSLIMQLGGV